MRVLQGAACWGATLAPGSPQPRGCVDQGGSRLDPPQACSGEGWFPWPSWPEASAELMCGMSSQWLSDRRVPRAAREDPPLGPWAGGSQGSAPTWGDPRDYGGGGGGDAGVRGVLGVGT